MSVKISKYIIGLLFVITLTFGIPVQAIQYESNDNIVVNEAKSNFHAAGNTIVVNQPISKDFVGAAQDITINGNIERNIIAAAQNISINNNVGGATRVAGQKINISGSMNDDVILFGQNIVINNATINGDLVVYANTLTLTNSSVTGDLIGQTSLPDKASLDQQVQGTISLQELNQEEAYKQEKQDTQAEKTSSFIYKELGAFVGLLVLYLLLRKKNRLRIPSINGTSSIKDFIIGAITCAVLPLLGIVSMILLFTIAGPLVMIIVGLMLLSSVFLPIYLGNLLKSTVLKATPISYLILGSFVLLVVLSLLGSLPILNFLVGLFMFLLWIANLGFILKKLYLAINLFLNRTTPVLNTTNK
jgi:hypothetical protein